MALLLVPLVEYRRNFLFDLQLQAFRYNFRQDFLVSLAVLVPAFFVQFQLQIFDDIQDVDIRLYIFEVLQEGTHPILLKLDLFLLEQFRPAVLLRKIVMLDIEDLLALLVLDQPTDVLVEGLIGHYYVF